MAVFDMAPEGVDPSTARLLTESVVGELRRVGTFSHIVASADMEAMLGLERQKQMLNCTQDSCMAEMAGALGVDFLVLGKVGQIGGTYLVTVKMLDVKGARLAGNAVKRAPAASQLPETTALATYELLQSVALLKPGVAAPVVPPAQEAARSDVTGGNADKAEGGGGGPRLPLVGVGAGALVLGALGMPVVLLLVGAAAASIVVPYYVAYVPTPGLPYAARSLVFPVTATALGVVAAVVGLLGLLMIGAGAAGTVAGFLF